MQTTLLLTEDLSSIVSFGGQAGLGRLSVDRDRGIIKNIKIIGFNSQNGRKYTPESLKEAVPMYEGIKVNIDHPEKGPTQQRSSHDRFGKFINVRFQEGEGVFGDLLYLKNHPLAESVCEAAEREEMNDVYGMSHNAQGEGTVDKKGIFVVSKITEVRHVDLVADPATTKSLTESQSADEQKTNEATEEGVRYKSKKQTPGARRGFVKAKSKGAVKPTGTLKEEEDPTVNVNQMDKEKKDLHYKVMQVLTKNDMADDKKADMVIDLISKEVGGKEMDTEENIKLEAEEAKEMKDEEKGEKAKEKDEMEEAETCEKCGSKYSKMEAKDEEKDGEDEDEDEEDDGEDKEIKEGEKHSDVKADKKMIKKEIAKAKMKESKDPMEQLAYYKAKDSIRDLCEAAGVEFDEELVEDLSGLTRASLERQIRRIKGVNDGAKPKCSPTKATFQESKEGKKIPEGDSLFRWLSN